MRDLPASHAGGCVCGAVRYGVDGPLRDVWNCHCERCRRFSGHHVAASAAAASTIRLDGEAALRWFEPASGVFYGFCSRCGSSLFWRADAHSEQWSICAGSLDQPTGLRTTAAWWMAEHADYHQRAPGLVEHDRDG